MRGRKWIGVLSAGFVAALVLGSVAVADETDEPAGPGGGRGGRMRARVLKKFDKDGDGKLSEDERKAVREARRERRGQGEGPGGQGGRRLPDPGTVAERLIERFDSDDDGKLGKKELAAAIVHLRHRRRPGGQQGGGQGPGGRRGQQGEGRGPRGRRGATGKRAADVE